MSTIKMNEVNNNRKILRHPDNVAQWTSQQFYNDNVGDNSDYMYIHNKRRNHNYNIPFSESNIMGHPHDKHTFDMEYRPPTSTDYLYHRSFSTEQNEGSTCELYDRNITMAEKFGVPHFDYLNYDKTRKFENSRSLTVYEKPTPQFKNTGHPIRRTRMSENDRDFGDKKTYYPDSYNPHYMQVGYTAGTEPKYAEFGNPWDPNFTTDRASVSTDRAPIHKPNVRCNREWEPMKEIAKTRFRSKVPDTRKPGYILVNGFDDQNATRRNLSEIQVNNEFLPMSDTIDLDISIQADPRMAIDKAYSLPLWNTQQFFDRRNNLKNWKSQRGSRV